MTDETTPAAEQAPDNDFASFEAKATEKPAPAAEATAAPERKPDDTLELGGEDSPVLTDEQKAEAADKDKKRGRPFQQRVDILTARLREVERENATLKATTPTEEMEDKAPNPDDYEFGEGDTKYIVDSVRHEMKQEAKAEKAKATEQDAANAAQAETIGIVRDGVAKVEADLKEKYPDFEEKIGEAMKAREGVPLPAVATLAISQSPVGADVMYRLATDDAAQDRIDKAVNTAMAQVEAARSSGGQVSPAVFGNAALAFGELEGEYLPADHDDADLDLSDPLDMMRMNGRMKARLAGKSGNSGDATRKITRAPTPAEERSRGQSGQFQARADTTDFASFEKMANAKK